MRVAVFRHVSFEDLGLIEPILRDRAIEVEYADLFDGQTPKPDISAADGLIVMGGPMSANDDLPHLRWEIECLRQAVENSQPVLGICLGAQLLAKSLGARVYRNPVKEIGWFEVQLTTEGKKDPLLRVIGASETIFQWHGETFDLPPDAAWLARSERCAHQAYRVGDNCYGLQFHLEVTPGMIADWCNQDANCGDMREVEQPIDPYQNARRSEQVSGEVFGSWCSLLR
jgi:GMP synthase (glutamine-hydrolysing)